MAHTKREDLIEAIFESSYPAHIVEPSLRGKLWDAPSNTLTRLILCKPTLTATIGRRTLDTSAESSHLRYYSDFSLDTSDWYNRYILQPLFCVFIVTNQSTNKNPVPTIRHTPLQTCTPIKFKWPSAFVFSKEPAIGAPIRVAAHLIS